MSTTAFVHGFTSTALLIMAIGAQNAFVLRQGLRREHVLPVVLVCSLSDAVLLQAGIWGMGGVLAARPEWAQFMRWAGAVFLVAYALQAAARACKPSHLLVSANGAGASLRTTLLTVLALTWLNPHVYLDTVVLLGTMASPYPCGAAPRLPRAARSPARCGSSPWGSARAGWPRCLPPPARGGCWMGRRPPPCWRWPGSWRGVDAAAGTPKLRRISSLAKRAL